MASTLKKFIRPAFPIMAVGANNQVPSVVRVNLITKICGGLLGVQPLGLLNYIISEKRKQDK